MRLYHVLLCCLFFAASCSRREPEVKQTERSKPVVYTVNYPLQYFAARIAGDAVEVIFPAMDGDPHFWKPKLEDVEAFQGADLILLNGASYALWVDRVSLPSSKVIDTSAAFAGSLIEIQDSVSHAHGPEGEHAHGGIAFTTWLDPELAIQQAEAIAEAFSRAWPHYADRFDEGLKSLKEDLQRLDGDLRAVTASWWEAPIIMSHPVYQYFARHYALNATSVHWEPDAMPDARQLEELKKLLLIHPANAMIWEAAPLPESVQLLKELGLASVVFDPCGNTPQQRGDYLSVMASNLANLKALSQRETADLKAAMGD